MEEFIKYYGGYIIGTLLFFIEVIVIKTFNTTFKVSIYKKYAKKHHKNCTSNYKILQGKEREENA